MFQEKLALERPIEIERADNGNADNGNNPRTIICNLVRYKDKVKLGGTNIFINEDFSGTVELSKQLRKEVKAHRDKGRVASLSCITVIVKKGGNFSK